MDAKLRKLRNTVRAMSTSCFRNSDDSMNLLIDVFRHIGCIVPDDFLCCYVVCPFRAFTSLGDGHPS